MYKNSRTKNCLRRSAKIVHVTAIKVASTKAIDCVMRANSSTCVVPVCVGSSVRGCSCWGALVCARRAAITALLCAACTTINTALARIKRAYIGVED
eukprot:10599-Heterococcus_DN1.PRE.2